MSLCKVCSNSSWQASGVAWELHDLLMGHVWVPLRQSFHMHPPLHMCRILFKGIRGPGARGGTIEPCSSCFLASRISAFIFLRTHGQSVLSVLPDDANSSISPCGCWCGNMLHPAAPVGMNLCLYSQPQQFLLSGDVGRAWICVGAKTILPQPSQLKSSERI